MTLSGLLGSWLPGVIAVVPDWVIAAATLAGTIAVALLVFRLLRAWLNRFAGLGDSFWMAVLRDVEPLLRFALVLLALTLVMPALAFDAAIQVTLNHVLLAAFITLLGWIAVVASNLALERYIDHYNTDTSDNLLARKAVTQIRVLKRTAQIVIILVTSGFALMTFDGVRQFGVSLFASAGIAGLALGLAAKPLLGNLIAGLQIAVTQPIRIDDAVVVEGEWGWIEEFTSTYVVIRLWDWRRLVVPLGYFLEKPFQNWTRTTSSIIGVVMFHLDHRTPVAKVREKLEGLVRASPLWDGQVVNLQVTDTTEHTIAVRALMSAENSSKAFDLRCEIREKLLACLQEEFPQSLPRLRADVTAKELVAAPD